MLHDDTVQAATLLVYHPDVGTILTVFGDRAVNVWSCNVSEVGERAFEHEPQLKVRVGDLAEDPPAFEH
jgi:hypothetical protein